MDHKPPELVEGEQIRAALEAAGLSMRDAADRTGIARTTFDRKLRGLSSFTSTDLRRIGRVLETKASTFLVEEGAA